MAKNSNCCCCSPCCDDDTDQFPQPQQDHQKAVTKQPERQNPVNYNPNPGVHNDEALESEDDSVSLIEYDQNSTNSSGPAAKSENERKRRRRKDNTSKNHQVRRQKPGDSLNKQEMTPIAGWKQDTSKGSHTDKPLSDRENKQPVTEQPKSIKCSDKENLTAEGCIDNQQHVSRTSSFEPSLQKNQTGITLQPSPTPVYENKKTDITSQPSPTPVYESKKNSFDPCLQKNQTTDVSLQPSPKPANESKKNSFDPSLQKNQTTDVSLQLSPKPANESKKNSFDPSLQKNQTTDVSLQPSPKPANESKKNSFDPSLQKNKKSEGPSSRLDLPQPHSDKSASKLLMEMELLKYDALECLLGEDFTRCISPPVKINDQRVVVQAQNSTALGYIKDKLNSLRQESVNLAPNLIVPPADKLNAKAEGVDAFIKLRPDNKIIDVLAFDYPNMGRAKHLVKIRTGQEKVTKRGERKFMQGDILVDGQCHLPPTKTIVKDFTTKSGIKVSVYKADITQLTVDAIVNAANEHLAHGGGVAAAIRKAAGCDFETECDEYIKKNGPLKVTTVALTTGGNLPCKKVIHAVGPRWKDYQNKTECQQHLEQTVFNCLETACNKFQSLAVSSISSAIFGVPKEICARMYLASIQRFDELHGGSTSLQHIHFVDVNDDMVNIIQESFTQLWDTLVTPSVSKNSSNHPVEPTPESKTMFGNETQANSSKMTNPNSELKSHESEKGEAVKATNEGAWNMDNKNEVLRNGDNLLFQSETSAGSVTPPNSKPTVSSISLSATPFSSLPLSATPSASFVPLTNTSTGISLLTITSIGTSATLTVTSTGISAPVTTAPTSNSVTGTTKSTGNSLTLTSKDFITTSGIKVIVNKEDITKLKVDAIVNATDVYLTHSGGVSLAIAKAGGSNLKAEGDKYISEHGQLRVSDVVVTTAGNLPCQKVLHTVGPCWDNYQDKTRCQQDLIQTVFNCLEKAHSLGLTSLAVCCISSATFGIPKEICAEMYLRALKRFSQHKNTSLKQIHFVDVNDTMVHVIQETFSKNWDKSNKQPTSGLHTLASGDSVSTDLQQCIYDNQDVTKSLNLPRLDFSQDVYCFSFSCLVLVFQRKKITEINTDAIFFWKQAESIFDDETRKQIIDISGGTFSNEDMRKTKKKLKDGCVDHTITANGKMLLFSVVPDNKICQDDVCHTMETLLFQVNKEKRKTIAIPETFYSRETASSSVSGLEAFAAGVYTAVEHYTHWPIKSVIEVHVLETNPDKLKTMVDTISLKVATNESVIEAEKNQRPKKKDDDEFYSAEVTMISEMSATQKKEIIHKKSNLPLNQISVTLETKTETKMETDASDEDMEIPASHTDRTTTFQTEIPLSQYKALVYLYREEFSHLFDVVLETGENMIVRARDDIAFKEIKEKMNTIRVERMKLPSDLVSDFEDTLKANAKTVHVFCLPNPDQGEVDIFSLDYGSMVKAKHLLNVTVGHIKVTSRSKRKFDHTQGEGNEDDGQLPSKTPSIVSKTLTPKDFKTESGIRVSVYKADITQLTVDAIVSAANEELAHGGGVAFAIARAAGFDLTDEGDKYIKVHGNLKVTNVVPTTAGNLPCKKVLHAVGPYWGDYQNKALCQQHLAQTIFNALETAHKLKFATLAMCSISSAIFAVPKDICARMYLAAVQRFDQQQGGKTSLQHIHFVDVSDEMVGIIQDTFTRLWDTSVIPPNSQPPVTGNLSKHGNASSKKNSKITSDVGEVRSQISHSTSPAAVSVDTSCVICHSPMTDPKTLPCKHSFCTKCIDEWFDQKPVCPCCQTVFGVLKGNQPENGQMKLFCRASVLPGYKENTSFVIEYSFPDGIQETRHPNPGKPYSGTVRQAYLPNTEEGRKVLMLLKVAFDRRLVFTVGDSVTSGQKDTVIWNNIHHKTENTNCSSPYGFPDVFYLSRVQEELATLGVTDKSLSDTQKQFIQNPQTFLRHHDTDLSHYFDAK